MCHIHRARVAISNSATTSRWWRRHRAAGLVGWTLVWLVGGPAALATTKGLNQIVTPDIQPAGVLSLSAQVQDARIANSQEVQLELGVTKWLEFSFFHGFRPREDILGAEVGLLQRGPHLLTAGAINWSSRGGGAAPVLEYGYYGAADHFIVGAIQASRRTEGILGYAHQLTPTLQLSADYQSGPGNFTTLGFTYNLTPDWQVNPAVYATNTRPHRALGYIVFTWNLPVWK